MQTIALFDLDGVIVDTEGQYTLFWEKVGKRDFPETEDFAARIKGHTLKQIVGEYYPNDAEKRQQVIEELWQFEREMDFPYIKGAVTFVRALREAKIPVAVVTSSDNKRCSACSSVTPNCRSCSTAYLPQRTHGAQSPLPIATLMLQGLWAETHKMQ